MKATPASAIVFAYHDVGVRCLEVLLDAGIDVRLVVTHVDDPHETIWFASVAERAEAHGIECVRPARADDLELRRRCAAAAPDFLFSFYYRHMLPADLLGLARRGAYNMHGSLLPQFRGRAPINWAVLHGARETGATLHAMDAKPDHGEIVDQCAVPILGDDTAIEVFAKVTTAAEIVLHRALPHLVAGTARHSPQDLSCGAYFGGRRPEDGRMPVAASAQALHDLVRAVAPPYPGAFFDVSGHRVTIERTLRVPRRDDVHDDEGFRVDVADDAVWIRAADGGRLRVLDFRIDGAPADVHRFVDFFGAGPVRST